MQKLLIIIFCTLLLSACASHPTISPIPLNKGESCKGVTLSAENVFPVFVYRKGLSDKSDVGIRLGIPFYGTGVDYSRIVFERDDIRDIINFGVSFSPNSNFDMTYYTVRQFPRFKKFAYYTGFRGMFIPKGINKNKSIRAGFLAGFSISGKWGVEAGYFHDFERGQPLEKIFLKESRNDERYPAVTDYGFPTENSRLTGLSFQLFINSNIFRNK